MGKAESTGTVEKQSNPKAYANLEGTHHTTQDAQSMSMACGGCDDGSHIRLGGVFYSCTVYVTKQSQ